MRLGIVTNAAQVIKAMRVDVVRQTRYAEAVAMTRTGKLAVKDISDAMARVFKQPTRYTLRSPFSTYATKNKLEVIVGIKDKPPSGTPFSPADILQPQFIGGTRRPKRLEFWLQRAGLISAGEFVVPGAGVRLNRYGNMSRGQVQQILSQLRAGPDPRAYKTSSAASRRSVKRAGRIFWSRGGHLPRGAWKATRRGVVPLLIVVNHAHYRALLDLQRIIEKTFETKLAGQFAIAYQQAMASARGSA